VMVRSPLWLAALGLFVAQSCPGWAAETPVVQPPNLAPTPVVSANQQLADTIALRLRQSGTLYHYAIDVGFAGGVAEVSGVVASPAQHDAALGLVRGVPGVERVIDRLEVAGVGGEAGASPIRRVQAEAPPGQLPQPLPGAPAVPPPPAAAAPPAAPPEAVPSFQAPPPTPYDLNPPRMPPYAWPTYAPYNNYSRVCYPTAYPYNAFPFIGPFYPFPKVPLGWRAVQLEWKDGYWWFSKLANGYDWWRLRFY
jgi:hypothetical protein